MTDSNLIPFNERSPKEVREMGSTGGIKSGVTRRQKRDLKKRIAATWELATKMKKTEILNDIKKLSKQGIEDEDPQVILLKDKIKVLGVGGVEMLTLMEIISDPKTSAMTKVMAIGNLFVHEYGKPKGSDTINIQWGSGISKSPAFNEQSILLGIKHGIAKLNASNLKKVIDMAESQIKTILNSEDALTSD